MPHLNLLQLLALPALATSVLLDCPNLPGVRTGISQCLGSPEDTTCEAELRIECDNMYSVEFFSESGIPCGSSSALSCHPEPNISYPNAQYSAEALDAVADLLAEKLERGLDNSDFAEVFDIAEQEIFLAQATKLNLTFLSEGACDRNSFGLTTFQAADPAVPGGDPRNIGFSERRDLMEDTLELSVVLPNTDFEFCQCLNPDTPDSYSPFCTESLPELRRGTTMRLLPDFRRTPDELHFAAGTFVTFFTLPDGFDLGYMPGHKYVAPMEQTLFATPELNDPDLVLRTGAQGDLRKHSFAFYGPEEVEVQHDDGSDIVEIYDFSDQLFFCFEDRRRFEAPGGRPPSNNDFEDLCVFVTADPPLKTLAPSAAPSPVGEPQGFCENGILSDCGDVCCAASCGVCGGCETQTKCSDLPGGPEMCCTRTILFNGIPCVASSDVGCVVDFGLICPSAAAGCLTSKP